MDAFLDDGFLIPTFEQLAALQIDYEGMVLGAYLVLEYCVSWWPGGPELESNGCYLPFLSLWKPVSDEQEM